MCKVRFKLFLFSPIIFNHSQETEGCWLINYTKKGGKVCKLQGYTFTKKNRKKVETALCEPPTSEFPPCSWTQSYKNRGTTTLIAQFKKIKNSKECLKMCKVLRFKLFLF